MADLLSDILSRKEFDEPPEMRAIKQYIVEHFQRDVDVSFRGSEIVVTVPSAALANMLRYHIYEMRDVAKTDKKIVLRIR